MTEPALFPFSSSAIRLLRRALTHQHLWLLQRSTIVFVCGARLDSDNSGRRVFLEYGRKHFPWCRFFLAEQAFDAIRATETSDTKDLLTIEGYLAESADAIIIIVESDGAKAELGAFAHDEDISKITLAINDVRHSNSGSFICDGPILKLDRVSKFKPMIRTRLDAIAKGLDEVSERLERIRRINRKRLHFDKAEGFLHLQRQHRVLMLGDLTWLLAPIRYSELISLLTHILGYADYEILRYDIALLEALDLIYRSTLDNREYMLPRPGAWESSYDFQDVDMLTIRSAVLAGFRRRDPLRLSLLTERIRGVQQ